MNPVRFWFSVFALLGWVIVVPGWLYFTGAAATSLPGEVEFLISLVLPVALLITLASWVQTG